MSKAPKYNIEEIKKAVALVGNAMRLARIMGIGQNAVYNWLHGKVSPDPLSCLKIQKATKGEVKAQDILPDYDWDKVI